MENKTVRDGSQNVKKRKLLYKVHYFFYFYVKCFLSVRRYASAGTIAMALSVFLFVTSRNSIEHG